MFDGNGIENNASLLLPLLLLLIVIDHGVGTYNETNNNNGLVW